VTLILFRVDATSNVHQLDFNKIILIPHSCLFHMPMCVCVHVCMCEWTFVRNRRFYKCTHKMS
jgi:hypothetical protein